MRLRLSATLECGKSTGLIPPWGGPLHTPALATYDYLADTFLEFNPLAAFRRLCVEDS